MSNNTPASLTSLINQFNTLYSELIPCSPPAGFATITPQFTPSGATSPPYQLLAPLTSANKTLMSALPSFKNSGRCLSYVLVALDYLMQFEQLLTYTPCNQNLITPISNVMSSISAIESIANTLNSSAASQVSTYATATLKPIVSLIESIETLGRFSEIPNNPLIQFGVLNLALNIQEITNFLLSNNI